MDYFAVYWGGGNQTIQTKGLIYFSINLVLSLFLTLYIFLHLTAMYSCTFRSGWLGRGCLHFTGMNTLVVLV